MKNSDNMKMVDVARFTFANDAAVLESILMENHIDYSLIHQDSAIIVPGAGTLLSVPEKEERKVRNIIKEAGFGKDLLPE